MEARYKRMVSGMQRKTAKGKAYGGGKPYTLYIIECSDGTFYTGVTNDIERRLGEHNAGKASKYTRTRRPVELRYTEDCADRAAALARECQVKKLSRKGKERLVSGK